MRHKRSAKRIVLSTFGSLGDVNPYVAIALELKAHGHRPLIAPTPVYRERIEALGIAFYPVRPELPSRNRPESLVPLFARLMHPNRAGKRSSDGSSCPISVRSTRTSPWPCWRPTSW